MPIGLPTDPIFRNESSPVSAQVVGAISVWPKAAEMIAFGNVSAMSWRVSRLAGDAPHEIASSGRFRSRMPGREHSACHSVGTRNSFDTRSDSMRSASASIFMRTCGGAMTTFVPLKNVG